MRLFYCLLFYAALPFPFALALIRNDKDFIASDLWEMTETKVHSEIYHYLRDSQYPKDFTKDEKRNLRKKAQKFVLLEGALFFVGQDKSKQPKRWIHDIDEQRKILTVCHLDDKIDGVHFGRDKTREKVLEN